MVIKSVENSRWYQIGVTSAKLAQIQTVEFVRVAYFVNWIEQIIQKN